MATYWDAERQGYYDTVTGEPVESAGGILLMPQNPYGYEEGYNPGADPGDDPPPPPTEWTPTDAERATGNETTELAANPTDANQNLVPGGATFRDTTPTELAGKARDPSMVPNGNISSMPLGGAELGNVVPPELVGAPSTLDPALTGVNPTLTENVLQQSADISAGGAPGGAGTGPYGGGGSSRGGGSYGGGSSGGYSNAYDNDYQMSEPPRYADGSTHPFFGGDPRVPGGRFNDGYSNRKSVEQGYPGSTPKAGAWGARASGPPAGGGEDSSPATGGKVVGDTGGGGGGGSDLYWALKGKIMGNLTGALGLGGSTSGGTTTGGGTSGGQGPATGDVPTRKLRGWAGRQGYKGAGLQSVIYNEPSFIALDAVKGLKSNSATFATLQGLPANELIMLANGGNRKWTGAPDAQANTLAQMYRQVATGPRWLDFQKLLKGFDPNKNSPLGTLMGKGATPAQQEYYFDTYWDAATNATMSPDVALAYQQEADALKAEWARKVASKRGGGPSLGRYVTRNIY